MPGTNGLAIGPELFSEASIPAEVAELNRTILDRLSTAPDIWAYPMPQVRAARAIGRGPFPAQPADPEAETLAIEGRGGPIPLRVIRPKTVPERGVYLHFHGGGWVMGTPAENDTRLRRLAEATGLATVSVDYRLAPEHPFPAGPDDCEDAALWLLSDEASSFERGFLAIGGESAGAHLAVLTLIRLRDGHGIRPFHAANLVAGCFDLSMTPSVRRWGADKLILNTRDIAMFAERFLQNGEDPRAPSVSPLHADLSGLPPALLTCGTMDLLIDDTLFLAARLAAAGTAVETAIFPGGCHVFQAFPTAQADKSLSRMETFLLGHIKKTAG